MQSVKLHVEALTALLVGEAGQHPNIRTVQVTSQGDWVDLFFVVQGDLGDGERAAFRVLDALAARFPDVGYDFLVLPSELYSSDFVWRKHAEPVFQRP